MNKFLWTVSLSIGVTFFAVAMDKQIVKKANLGQAFSCEEREKEFRRMSDAGEYIVPRSRERKKHSKKIKRVSFFSTNITSSINDNNVTKRRSKKEQPKIIAPDFKEQASKRTSLFPLHTVSDSPVYNKLLFELCVKAIQVEDVVGILQKDKELRTHYSLAQKSYAVLNNEVSEVYIEESEVRFIPFNSIEATLLELARQGNNTKFLSTYEEMKSKSIKSKDSC